MPGTDVRKGKNKYQRDDGRWYTEIQRADLLRRGQWGDYVAPRPVRPVAPVAPVRPAIPPPPIGGPGLPPAPLVPVPHVIIPADLLERRRVRIERESDAKIKEQTRQNEAIAPANISTSTGVVNRGVNLGSGRRHKMGRKVKVQRGRGPFGDFIQKQMDKSGMPRDTGNSKWLDGNILGGRKIKVGGRKIKQKGCGEFKTMGREATTKLFNDRMRDERKIQAGTGLGFYDGLKFW